MARGFHDPLLGRVPLTLFAASPRAAMASGSPAKVNRLDPNLHAFVASSRRLRSDA